MFVDCWVRNKPYDYANIHHMRGSGQFCRVIHISTNLKVILYLYLILKKMNERITDS